MKNGPGILLTTAIFWGFLYPAFSQVAFAPAVTYGVGQNPDAFTVADINGDGKMDLIVGNEGASPYNNGSLSILTNDGSGHFVLASTLALGHGPGSIAAADVNGDGYVDLITPNWDNGNGNTISIWTNNGAGVFGSNATLNAGTGARGITAADINGDGKIDLICANLGTLRDGNTLSIFTNNGRGVFSLSQTPAVGTGPYFAIAADVNGDGHVDLVTANGTDGSMTVLTNNGSGVFGSNATYNVGSGLTSVAGMDVNGDGKIDLITGSGNNGNTLSIWTNNGAGIFYSNATYVVGEWPYSVVAADINGDGQADLISANFSGDNSGVGNLSVLTNNGAGGFALAATLVPGTPVGDQSDYPIVVAAVDVNGDGKLDLACINIGDNTVAVLKNTSIFPAPASTPPLRIHQQGKMAVVSWPSASPGWSLLQNPDLTTSHWGPAGYTGYRLTDDGTNKSLATPPEPGNLYFRLIHP